MARRRVCCCCRRRRAARRRRAPVDRDLERLKLRVVISGILYRSRAFRIKYAELIRGSQRHGREEGGAAGVFVGELRRERRSREGYDPRMSETAIALPSRSESRVIFNFNYLPFVRIASREKPRRDCVSAMLEDHPIVAPSEARRFIIKTLISECRIADRDNSDRRNVRKRRAIEMKTASRNYQACARRLAFPSFRFSAKLRETLRLAPG